MDGGVTGIVERWSYGEVRYSSFLHVTRIYLLDLGWPLGQIRIPSLLLEESQCVWHVAVGSFGKKLSYSVLKLYCTVYCVSNASKLPTRFLFENQPWRLTRRSKLGETGCTINWPLNHCGS